MNFEVGHLKKLMKKYSKRRRGSIQYAIISVYFMYFEGIIEKRTTHRACYVSEKAYNCSVQGVSS